MKRAELGYRNLWTKEVDVPRIIGVVGRAGHSMYCNYGICHCRNWESWRCLGWITCPIRAAKLIIHSLEFPVILAEILSKNVNKIGRLIQLWSDSQSRALKKITQCPLWLWSQNDSVPDCTATCTQSDRTQLFRSLGIVTRDAAIKSWLTIKLTCEIWTSIANVTRIGPLMESGTDSHGQQKLQNSQN